jgi:hypothetical protein
MSESFIQALRSFRDKKRVNAELRLYYDDHGNVICYSMDHLDGNYIIVDVDVYAQGRYDIVVKNNVVHYPSKTTHGKIKPSITGTPCHVFNALIVDIQSKNFWKFIQNE